MPRLMLCEGVEPNRSLFVFARPADWWKHFHYALREREREREKEEEEEEEIDR